MARANPNTSPWKFLSDKEKTKLLYKYERGVPVSVEGMKKGTLKTRLREWRHQVGTTIPEEEVLDEETSVRVEHKDDNHVNVSARDENIHTIEDLIEYCKIDLDIWQIEKVVANTWSGYRKQVEKDLEWDQGVVGGYVKDTGGFVRVTLPQIKVWLVRKNPVPLHPIVTPIEFHISSEDLEHEPLSPDRKVKRALIIPDMHVGFYKTPAGLDPFHDRDALAVALEVAGDKALDKIIFLGDLLDLPDWSDKFLRSPEFEGVTQPAIIEAAWWLAQFRMAAPEAEIYVLEGNHEVRMNISIIKHARASYGLKPAQELDLPGAMSVPRLLGLHTLGITWVGDYPNGKVWLNNELCAVHGDAVGQPGATGGKLLKNADYGVVYGHIHRIETSSRTVFSHNGNKNFFAVSPGCVCRVDGIVPARSKENVWQQGIGYVYYNDEESSVVVSPINNGSLVFEGLVYEGDGETAREILAEDYPDYPF